MTEYFAKDPTHLALSVSAIVWRDRKLLLMRRADNGYWGLPGGFVEVGESVADAARREVVEETGWSVELGRLIGVYSDPAKQVVDYSTKSARESGIAKHSAKSERGRVQVVNLCFEAKALSRGQPSTPDETLEMGFFSADALPGPFVPIHSIRIQDGLADRPEAAIR